MLIQIAPEKEGGPGRLIDRDRLELSHHMHFEANAHVHAMEWRLDGVLVRRDVWVNILRGQSLSPAAGAVGG